MQPESNEISQNIRYIQLEDNHHNVHYGFSGKCENSVHQHEAEDGRDEAANYVDSSRSSDGNIGKQTVGRPLRRLNSSSSKPRTPSPVDKIIEHENASVYTNKKKSEGLAFTVVPSVKKRSTKENVDLDFPNEIFTHIFSYLPPATLLDVSLSSRRFHELVTAPHAWRAAFARFFPGSESLSSLDSEFRISEEDALLHSEKRIFTRLTALASWRSEYIRRTHLLRSLSRGKPSELPGPGSPGVGRAPSRTNGNAQITYSSELVSIVSHLQANFVTGLNKTFPRFIHGTDDLGAASTSDPRLGKVDSWGDSDPNAYKQFADLFPGDAQHGLGDGDVVGVPNVMDVSQPYGMLYGEGLPGGGLWYRPLEEKRSRSLCWASGSQAPETGIPMIGDRDAVCSVWISKTRSVPELSEGLIGMLSGSSSGILTAYSLGTSGVVEPRLERGQITARWVLSPGVPIIAIAVDEEFSRRRLILHRIWAVVLNALGEVFYLTEIPAQPDSDPSRLSKRPTNREQQRLETRAWASGRTVHWTLVEPTRRIAKLDPFHESDVDGSYSPRCSWNGMHLSPQQLAAETREIETFLPKKPKYFRNICEGWDMCRRLEVDFAAFDENGAGEGIVVIRCGMDEGQVAELKRFTRCRFEDSISDPFVLQENVASQKLDGNVKQASLFGNNPLRTGNQPTWSFGAQIQDRRNSVEQSDLSTTTTYIEEWCSSVFSFGDLKSPQITATAVDMSSFALSTVAEDPLLSIGGSSLAASSTSSPLGEQPLSNSPGDVPGQRARLMAIGTKTGTVLLWNMRAPTVSIIGLENTVKPVRIIYTDSPQISALGLTALYLVHGGNDGLVQAWDPLASTTDPIRTLHSRFTSRARRQLVQAEVSVAGVGINLFAAGAICLDPDPTVLRGMVSIGSQLRYWSYNSQAAEQYKGSKRRLRRSERGSNQGGGGVSDTGRGALKEYIANEKFELEREKVTKSKEEERLAGRFGVDLLGPGACEDEMLAYAVMLSEEAAYHDELRRKSASEGSSSETVTEEAAISSDSSVAYEEGPDDDMAMAVRLNLQEIESHSLAEASGTGSDSFRIKYIRKNKRKGSPGVKSSAAFNLSPQTNAAANSSYLEDSATPLAAEDEDLEEALLLSRAEEERRELTGKGKGRAR